MHWYDDGYVIGTLWLIFIWLPVSLIPIFGPTWAGKVIPFFRLTPRRGKLLGAIMLLAFAQYAQELLERFFPSR